MHDYRLYCLDGARRFTEVHHIVAANDQRALLTAQEMKLRAVCELWHGARFVATLPPFN